MTSQRVLVTVNLLYLTQSDRIVAGMSNRFPDTHSLARLQIRQMVVALYEPQPSRTMFFKFNLENGLAVALEF